MSCLTSSHILYSHLNSPQLGEIVSISELKEKHRIGVRVLNTEVIDGIPLEAVIIRDHMSENMSKNTIDKNGTSSSPSKAKNRYNFIVEKNDKVKSRDAKKDKDKEKRKTISKNKSTSSIKLKFGEITIVSKSNSDERLLGSEGCQELGSTHTSSKNLSGMDGVHRPKIHRPVSAPSTHVRTVQTAHISGYSGMSKSSMGGSKSNVDNRRFPRDGCSDYDGAHRNKNDNDHDDLHANSNIDYHDSMYSDGQCNSGSQARERDREITRSSEQAWSRQGHSNSHEHTQSQRAKIASVPSSGTYDSLMNDSVISLNSLDSDRSSSYREHVPVNSSSSRYLREGDRDTDRRRRRGEGYGDAEGDGEVGDESAKSVSKGKDYSWMKPLRPSTATSRSSGAGVGAGARAAPFLSLTSTSREHKHPFSAADSMSLGVGPRDVRDNDFEHCDSIGNGRVSYSNSNSNTCEEYDSDDMLRAGYSNYSSTDTNSNDNGNTHRALYRGKRQGGGQGQRHDMDAKADDSNYRYNFSKSDINGIYRKRNSNEIHDTCSGTRNPFDSSRQEMNPEKVFFYDSTGSDDKVSTIGRTERDKSVPHYARNQLFEFDQSKLQSEHSALHGTNGKSSFVGGTMRSNSAVKSKSDHGNGNGYGNGTGMGDRNNNNTASSSSHSHGHSGTKTKSVFSSSSDAQRASCRPATAGSRQQQAIKQNFADMFSNGKGFDVPDEKEKIGSFSRTAQHSSSTDNVKNDMGSRKGTKVFNKFGVTNNFEVPDKLPNAIKSTEFSLSGLGYGNDSHTNKGTFTDFSSTNNSTRKNTSAEKDKTAKSSFSRPQSASTVRRPNTNTDTSANTNPFEFAKKQEDKERPKGKTSLADYFTNNEFLIETDDDDKTSADKIDTKEFVYKYEDYTNIKESGRNDRSSNSTVNERSSNSERSCSSTLKSSTIKDYYDTAEVERKKREKILIARESTRAEKELLRQKILLENELKSLQNVGKNKS